MVHSAMCISSCSQSCLAYILGNARRGIEQEEARFWLPSFMVFSLLSSLFQLMIYWYHFVPWKWQNQVAQLNLWCT